MNTPKILGFTLLAISLVFGVIFYENIQKPIDFQGYFQKSYYSQFGPIAICVELFIAGYYLFQRSKKANFAMALFGFTAILDILFHITGLLSSGVPVYGMITFVICAALGFYISFSNAFDLGKITLKGTLVSFIMGNAVELFFNFY